MLGRVELARAGTWDAARVAGEADVGPLTAAAAVSLALDAAFANGKDCIQVLGGIGFTWEHDAHLYLRRASALRSLLGPASAWRVHAARHALGGARRPLTVDLGPDADTIRAQVRSFLDEVRELPADEQRRRVADAGFIMPTWPKPWGRDAKPAEQLVIEEEFRRARVPRPEIMIGGWALPPVTVYVTRERR